MNNILKNFILLLILMLFVSLIFAFLGINIFGSIGGYAGSLVGILLLSTIILKSLFRNK